MSSYGKLIVTSLLLSFSCFTEAKTWLCIGEHAASVTVDTHNNNSHSDAHSNDNRFLVSTEGVSWFGVESKILSDCTAKGNRPIMCVNGSGNDGWWFNMSPTNSFILKGMGFDGSTRYVEHYLVAGKCNQL